MAGISGGRPCKLTRQQRRALLRRLRRGALSAGFPTDQWTLPRICQVIEREFAVRYHPKYLNRLLRRLGWTPQLPQPVPAERDEALVRAWLEKDWPRIKKARRRGADIVLFDETGFTFLAPVGRTWGERGHRPTLRRVTKERRVWSAAVGLALSGHIYKRQFDGAVDGPRVVAALKDIGRQVKGCWVLSWDRAPIHRAGVVTT